MNEQTQTIIDRARALLAGIAGTHVNVTLVGDRIEAHHAFHTQSPAIVAALCNALEAAERRAEEAEDERELLKQMLPPGAGVVAATIGEMTRKCETLQAENEDLTAELNRACVELTASDEAFESQARQYAAIRDEIDALRAEGFSMSAEIVAAERDALKRRAEEAEAQAAAMREALVEIAREWTIDEDGCAFCGDGLDGNHDGCPGMIASKATASDAGRPLLDRLRAAEAEVARLKAREPSNGR